MIDNYKLIFKNDKFISLDRIYPNYYEIYIQIIFDNHISLVKKRKSTEWWLLTSGGFLEAQGIFILYNDKGFNVKGNIFDYGIAFINYGRQKNDLESVIYMIGIFIFNRLY